MYADQNLKAESSDITIGVYLERPDGVIVKSYGAQKDLVLWYDDDGGRGQVSG